MVSKTRKQRQKKKEEVKAHGGVVPVKEPLVPKSVHLKKTRPKMKGKQKIRLGLECPTDIYAGFEDQKGVLWTCPTCAKECRTMGYCVDCATGTKSRVHVDISMARRTTKTSSSKRATGTALKIKRGSSLKLKMKKKK